MLSMTSVQNHLQPLNGSKIAFLLSLLVFISSCTTTKKVQKTTSVPKVEQEVPEMIRVYDPETNSYVLKPVHEQNVDTIYWENDDRPEVVLSEEKQKETEPGEVKVIEDKPLTGITHIAVALPLQTESEISRPQSRDTRFIQFYAGLRIGFNESKSPEKFDVNVIHTQDSNLMLAKKLVSPQFGFPNIIIGPYDRASIEGLLPEAEKNNAIVLSPWMPSFLPKTDSPLLFQLTPGLSRHAETIMNYVQAEMADQNIVIVIRDTPAERKRAELFKSFAKLPVKEFIIKDKSSTLANTDVLPYLEEKGTVFILPFYSKSDETFVNSFMRKVHAERLEKPVTIFGLPQWSGFSNLNANYMESLSLHLSEPFFTLSENEALDNFRDKFFREYNTVPDINAYQGYDLAKWIDHSLNSGNGSLRERLLRDWDKGISSSIHFVPTVREGNEMNTPAYMENACIHIVRYLNQDYQLVK